MHMSESKGYMSCESPRLTEVGSVTDLTLGEGWSGRDDTFVFTIGRFDVSISYGELS